MNTVDKENNFADGDSQKDYFDAYLEYNKALRTWFVAFGVGGPALLLANQQVATALSKAQQLECVAIAFLIGICAQIAGALLNKVANWYVYANLTPIVKKESIQYKVSYGFLGHFWIDWVIDAVTIIAFCYASWKMIRVLIP